MIPLRIAIASLIFAMVGAQAQAQSLTPSTTLATLQAAIVGNSNGATITNFKITANVAGSSPARVGTGTFANAGGFASGVVLRTGLLGFTSRSADAYKTCAGCDTTIVEFDVTPTFDSLGMNYSFFSWEFPEYVCSAFNDNLDILVTGPTAGPGTAISSNLAQIPNSSTPIQINTVNAGFKGRYQDGTTCTLTNSAFYKASGCAIGANSATDCDTSGAGAQYGLDGGTVPLRNIVKVTAGSTYHIKVLINDVGDNDKDSQAYVNGVFSNAPNTSIAAVVDKTGPVLIGTQLVYTITLTNNSLSSDNVTVTNPIPANASYVAGSASVGGSLLGTDVVWPNVTVPGGICANTDCSLVTPGETTLTYKVDVTAGPSVQNATSFASNLAYTPTNTTSSTAITTVTATYSASGQIWDDANSSLSLDGLEAGTNAGGLTVYAVNASNVVVGKASVQADGTYSIPGLLANTYTLRLSSDASKILGDTVLAPSLPAGWINTGENANGTPEPTTLGEIIITVGSNNLTNQNFGIEKLPNTDNQTVLPQINPGGTNTVQVPTITYTDLEDNAGTSSTANEICIETLPTNATLAYNGSSIGSAPLCVAGYNPALLTIDPQAGDQTINFTVRAKDAAGQKSATPATISMSFTNQAPSADAKTGPSIASSAGDTALSSVPLTGTDPDGSVASFRLTSLPNASEGTLKWDDDNNTLTPPVAVTTSSVIPASSADKLFFDPSGSFSGTSSFAYVSVDDFGLEASSPATYLIPVANTAPVASNDAITTAFNTAINLDFKSNDTDLDGTINPATIDLDPSTPALDSSLSVAQGTFTLEPDGAVKFAPVAGFVGTLSAPYTVQDNLGATSNPAMISVTVSNPPAPTASNDTSSTPFNTAVRLEPKLNDSASSGTTLDASKIDLDPSTPTLDSSITVTGGSFTLNTGSGEVVFQPDLNFVGTASISYTIQDSLGQTSNPATLAVTIATPPAPIANNDTGNTLPSTSLLINVVSNDTPGVGSTLNPLGIDLDPSTPAQDKTITIAGEGTYTLLETGPNAGQIEFAPLRTFSGLTTPITYTIADMIGQVSTPATITVEVLRPAAITDAISTVFNTPVKLEPALNDLAPPGFALDPLTIDLDPNTVTQDSSFTVPGQGTFTLISSGPNAGQVTFTPETGFIGTSKIEYTISDTAGVASNIAYLEVTVTPPAAPVANDDAITGGFNQALNLEPKLNDLASPGTTLDTSKIDLDPSTPTLDSSITVAAGTFTLEPDGSVKFTPIVGFVGAVSLPYTVQDSLGQTSNPANLTVTVLAAPIATDDTINTAFQTATTLEPAINDTSSAGSTLASSTIDLDPSTPAQDKTFTVAGKGTFTLIETGIDTGIETGKVSFTPLGNFVGTASTPYTITDSLGGLSNPANLSISVAPPAAPTASSDSASTAFNTPVNLEPALNDTPGTGITLDPNTIDLDPSTPTQDSSFTVASGTFTLEPNGTVTFAPTAGFVGSLSTPYTIKDALGQTSNSANVQITVNAPAAPVASDDSASTANNTAVNLEPALNDTSSAGTTINTSSIDLDPSSAGQQKILNIPGKGTFKLIETGIDAGKVSFTPEASFYGAITQAYTVEDSLGQTSNPANLTVTVGNPAAPIAVADTSSTAFNTGIVIDAQANDSASPGTTLDSSKIDLDPSTPTLDSSITVAAGTFTLEPDGTVKFTAVAGFVGTASTPYTIQDSLGQTSNSATLEVTVIAPPVPVATNDSTSTPFNTPVTVDAKLNDSSSAGTTLDPSKIDLDPSTPTQDSSITISGKGSLTLESDGTVKFTPEAGFVGTVSTPYTIQDSLGQISNAATLEVTVNTPLAPVATADSSSTPFNTAVIVDVKLNDTSSPGTTLVSSKIDLDPSTPSQDSSITVTGGVFSLEADGTIKFTPTIGFVGTATTPYTIQDSLGQLSNSASLSVSVNNPAAPVATNDSSTTPFNTALDINVKLNDTSSLGTTLDSSKIDLDPSTPAQDSSVTIPGKGSFLLEADGTIQFTPIAGFVGVASTPYMIQDSLGQVSNAATLEVTVSNPPAPVAIADTTSTAFNTAVTIDAKVNDTSSAGTTLNSSTIDLDPSTPAQDSSIALTGGIFTLEADGTVLFTPTAGFVGTVTTPYSINDSLGQTSNTAILTVTVINPNGPTAISDSATTTFNTAVTIDAKANDLSAVGTTLNSSKIDLDPSTPALDSGVSVAAGTFTLEADGSVTFTPVAGFVGIASTPYTIQDSLGQTSASANLTVTISNPPAAIAMNDSTSTAFNAPVNLEPKLNDTSSIGTTLDASTIDLDPSTPAQDSSITVAAGTFNLQPDGSVTFTPTAGFVGTASTNYTIQDSLGQTSNIAALEVTVNAPPVPVATNDSSSTPFNTAVIVDVKLNDTSSPGTTLVSSKIDLDPSTPALESSITISGKGTFTLEVDGTIQFTPVAGFVGTATTPYTIRDSLGQVSNTTDLSITVSNPPTPVASNDSSSTAFNTAVVMDVKLNDTSSTGTTLDSSKIDLDPSTPTLDSSFTVVGQGAFTLEPDGTITFTPETGFVGTVTTPYTINDNLGQASNIATLEVRVNAPPVPVATNDSSITGFNTPVVMDVKLNDSSSAGTTLESSKIDLDPSTPSQDSSITIAGKGTFSLEPDGAVKFTPDAGFVGTASAPYTVQDSLGQVSNAATLEVTVNAPLAPVATGDVASTTFNTPVTVNVKSNDTSSTGTTLNANTIDLDPSTPLPDSSITVAAGTFTLEPDGTIKFNPVAGFVGTATTPYTIQDSLGQVSNPVNLTVTVNNPAAPIAVADTTTTAFNTAVTVDLALNDSSSAGTTLTASTIDLDPSTATQDSSITIPGKGTFSLEVDGTLKFVPIAGFVGNVITPYTIQDSLGQVSNAATLEVMVINPNGPTASNDSVNTTFNTPITVDVKANDVSSAGTTLDSSKIDLDPSTPSQDSSIPITGGVFTLEVDGTIKFVPTPGFVGTASATYTVQDSLGQISNGATLTVTVSNPPAPVATNDSGITSFNAPITVDVKSNDTSSTGTTLDVSKIDLDPSTATQDSSISIPGKGTFSLEPDGTVKFTPVAGFTGTLGTNYTIQDSLGQTSNPATLTITVNPALPQPIADASSTALNTPVVIDALANDAGGLNPASLTVPSSGPDAASLGVVTVAADGKITYTPNAGTSGADTFSYTVCDTAVPTPNCATASITVNIAPQAVGDTSSTVAGTPVTFAVASNDLGGVNASSIDLEPNVAGIQTTKALAEGLFTANPDGTVSFSPAVGFSGPIAPIAYTIQNAAGIASPSVTITVNVTPKALNDAINTASGAAVNIAVLSNDLGTIDPASLDLDPSAPGIQTSKSVPEGTFSINPDSSLKFVPTAGFTGPVTPITYAVEDSSGQVTNGTLSVNVGTAIPPVATADALQVTVGAPTILRPLSSDTAGTYPIDPSTLDLDPSAPGIQNSKTIPGQGVFVANPDGSLSFTPETTFSGAVAPITYTIADQFGNTSNPTTVNVTVTPKAVNDTANINAGETGTLPVSSNDLGTINPGTLDLEPDIAGIQTGKTIPGQGVFVANPNGSISFTPELGFSGPVTPLRYQIQDSSAQVTAAILSVNVAPKLANDNASTYTNNPVTIKPLANDQGNLDQSTLDLDPSTPGLQTSFNTPHGTLKLEPDGSLLYTPNTGFDGTDSFTYEICDHANQCVTAIVNLSIGANLPPLPTAHTEALTSSTSTLLLAPLQATDSDDSVTSYTVSSLPSAAQGKLWLGDPSNGGTPVNAGQVLTPLEAAKLYFVPVTNFSGAASFSFSATDDRGAPSSTPATVTIPVNAAPVTYEDTVAITLDTPVTILVLTNDTDLDGTLDPSSIDLDPSTAVVDRILIVPDQGTFTVNATTGEITFIPQTGFTGSVTVPYSVQDNRGAHSNTSSITVNVQAGTVNGHVFNDLNGNGIQDANENNLASIGVNITPEGKPAFTVRTDANGNYRAAVPAGKVSIDVTDPANSRSTTGNDPQTLNVADNASVPATPVGFQGLEGGLSGRVFEDTNGNGQQDANEPGIAGVSINITARDGTNFSVTSDANGNYNVPTLTSGPASIEVITPDGFVLTSNNPQSVNVPAGKGVTANPVGFIKPGLSIQLEALQKEVQVGGTLEYKIRLLNTTAIDLQAVEVVDELPVGVIYQPGTARIAGLALEPRIEIRDGHQVLVWTLPNDLPANASSEITFATTVTPKATGNLANKASAKAQAGSISAPVKTAEVRAAVASVKIVQGTFSNQTALVGRVYFDKDQNRQFDPSKDEALAGARVYLSDGRYAITDAQGRYNFAELEPGEHVLRLDPLTAPYQAESIPGDSGLSGTRMIIARGGLQSADFPLIAANGEVQKLRSTTVTRGPVTLEKNLIEAGAGYAVSIKLQLAAPVQDLRLIDPLPTGATRGPIEFGTVQLVQDGQVTILKLDADGHILIPGLLEAGTYELRYAIFTDLPADLVITDPSILYTEVIR